MSDREGTTDVESNEVTRACTITTHSGIIELKSTSYSVALFAFQLPVQCSLQIDEVTCAHITITTHLGQR